MCGPGSDGGANDAPLPAEGSSMTEVVFSARILLGLVFVVAGLTKLSGFREFSLALPRLQALQDIGLFRLIPAGVVAASVVGLELSLAALLVSAFFLSVSSVLSALLLGVMTTVMARNYFSSAPEPCSCFGRQDRAAGLGAVSRDVFLLLAAAVLLVESVRHGFPGPAFRYSAPSPQYILPSCGLLLLGILSVWLLGMLDQLPVRPRSSPLLVNEESELAK